MSPLLFLALLVPLAVVLPQLGAPLGYDDSVYVTVVRGIAEGLVPYRDVFDHKPPLIYAWYAAVLAIDDSPGAIRLSIAASLSATVAVTWWTARAYFERPVADAVALAFALTTGLAAVSNNAAPMQLMLLPLTGALGLVLRWHARGDARLLVAAGVAGALAGLFKPVVLPNLLVLGLLAIAWRRSWADPLRYIAGGLATAAVAFAPFVALGAARETFDAVVTFNREYVAATDVWGAGERLEGGLRWALLVQPLTLLVLATVPLLARASRVGGAATNERERALVLGGWFLASLGGAASGGMFLPHYIVQVFPAGALLGGVLFEWLRATEWRLRTPAVTAGAVLVAALFAPHARVLADYDAHVRRTPAVDEVAAYLRAEASAGDRLWTSGPDVYYYAELLPGHRYFFRTPLAIRPSTVATTVAELAAEPPAYIVAPSSDGRPEVDGLLGSMYAPVFETGGMTVWRLATPALGAGVATQSQ